MRRFVLLALIGLTALVGAATAWYIFLRPGGGSTRDRAVMGFLRNPEQYASLTIRAGTRCGTAPFQMPTDGLIGYLWGDSFRPGHTHQGIDIFGGSDVGLTPVRAAYDGYLTRLEDWKSTVIIRVPSDPLQPGRQIWTYYTHMADAQGESLVDTAFPPGTQELFVPAGTLLGWQGNFSGTPGNPVGVHLHFSIVRDDGQGRFLNELEIGNTLDPSPYFDLPLQAGSTAEVPTCQAELLQ